MLTTLLSNPPSAIPAPSGLAGSGLLLALSGLTALPTPAGSPETEVRGYVVEAENRTWVVDNEDRSFDVEAESRLATV